MRLDGRFEPLTCLAQAAALVGVLITAAVAWWRHDRPQPARPTFYEPREVTGPRNTWR